MLLTIPVEDLLASQLDIKLGHADGRLSCKLKPNSSNYNSLAPKSCASLILNLESVQGDNGYTLSLYASPDESVRLPPPTPSDPPLAPPADCNMHEVDFSQSMPAMDIDNNFMSFLLSDASPPPDYFSDNSYAPSPASVSSGYSLFDKPEINGDLDQPFDFDFASSCMSAGNGDFDTHQFSRLMGIASNDSQPYTSSSPPSDPGPSRLASPSPAPVPDVPNASTSASASPSASSPSSTHTNFITAASPVPEPPTAGENRSGKTGRRAQYPCLHPTCERVLTSPYTRQVHMGTHKTKVRKGFPCTLGCGEAFTRQHDRQRHEVALHGKKCKHVCTRCRRFFSSAKMLDRHVCRGHRQGAIQWPLGDEEVPDVIPVLESP
ncbi:hypothetical protein DFH09DRAFT_1416469 [Mycena vulgaris]|nr:hypothetical protein DFH09DRAFT_1416469 [Mycena vulgaris]